MIKQIEPLNMNLAQELTGRNSQHVWYEQDQKYFIQVTKLWRAVLLFDTIKHYYPNAYLLTPVDNRTQITVCIGTVFDFIQHPPPIIPDIGNSIAQILAEEIAEALDQDLIQQLSRAPQSSAPQTIEYEKD